MQHNYLKFLSIVRVLFAILFFNFLSIVFNPLSAQEIRVIKADELFSLLEQCDEDKDLCIYNFWATWCAPCIREIPLFEKINSENKRVSIRLISLDEAEELHGRVTLFVRKKDVKSEVFLLDETDFNEIIPRVSEEWSGAIPATIMIDKNGDRHFFEREFKEGELQQTINSIIQN
jgi:thiol-disulfide isomerase/thioredoxin